MHPKLNWDNFDAVYAARKKRRRRFAFLYWSFVFAGLAFTIFHFVDYSTPFTAVQNNQKNSISFDPEKEVRVDSMELGTIQTGLSKTSTSEDEEVGMDQESQETAIDISSSKPNQTSFLSTLQSNRGTTTEIAQTTSSVAREESQSMVCADTLLIEPIIVEVEARTPTVAFGEGQMIDSKISQWSDEFSINALVYHSSWLKETENSNYYSFVSPQIGFESNFSFAHNWQLFLGVNASIYRYQSQLTTSYEGTAYKPGSIVSYRRLGNQYTPVFSDTVNGVYTRQYHQNGTIQSISIPLGVRYSYSISENLEVRAAMGGDINFLYRTNGVWLDDESIVEVPSVLGQTSWLIGLNAEVQLRYSFDQWGVQAGIRGGGRLPFQSNLEIRAQFVELSTGVYYAW